MHLKSERFTLRLQQKRTHLFAIVEQLATAVTTHLSSKHVRTHNSKKDVARDNRSVYCDIDIESEFHFLFYSPLYHELHQKLFDRHKQVDLMWLSDAERLK